MSALKFSALDQKIIKLLLEDGRMPYTKIGEVVGLSSTAVAEHVEKLIKAGHIRVQAWLNPDSFGLPCAAYFFVHFQVHDLPSFRAFERLVEQEFKEIQTCAAIAGERDYLMSVEGRDHSHVASIADRLIAAVRGIRIETLLVTEPKFVRPIGL